MKGFGILLARRLHGLDGTNELGLFQKHQPAKLLDTKGFGISGGGRLEIVSVDLTCNLFRSLETISHS